ncbi:MAG TPA: class I SAM-dependent methyltransferase [Candidatus Nanopelagicales bacterium]|jgi:ubiquinone/menaquinone biosynthesis C-methylase UbiE|nr:class I SAM-dependent methyltransferase [Candidatus Nanopelagicales bacterium]
MSGEADGFRGYYRSNVTFLSHLDRRLAIMVEAVVAESPSSVLDIGCGRGFLLGVLAEKGLEGLSGVDVYDDPSQGRFRYRQADVTEGLPFNDSEFDCVVAGEIIEHVPDPDSLLREIRRVLSPQGLLVLSTPNLVSWANRVLVPLGIQPLGTETSSEIALGRRLKVLGQGNQVQGHLKVFTHRALSEILQRYGFEIVQRRGVPSIYPFPVDAVDRLLSRRVSIASGLVYCARSPAPPWPIPVAGRRHIEAFGE